jgi:hypothetical protein
VEFVKMRPEEKLWLNTLVRGLCDSVGLTHPNFDVSEHKVIKEAQEWLGSSDFKAICGYLKLNSNYILKLHEKIKKQKKSNTERVYNALYIRITRLKFNYDYFSSP